MNLTLGFRIPTSSVVPEIKKTVNELDASATNENTPGLHLGPAIKSVIVAVPDPVMTKFDKEYCPSDCSTLI